MNRIPRGRLRVTRRGDGRRPETSRVARPIHHGNPAGTLHRVIALACLLTVLFGCATSGGLASLPRPEDLRIIPPPPGLAPGLAAFWGIWEGYWKGSSGVLPSRLIVERIDSETADVVYVWGDDPQGHFKAGYGRFRAKVSPRGILEFGWRHATLVFEMREDRKSIEGGRVHGSTISAAVMRRVGP